MPAPPAISAFDRACMERAVELSRSSVDEPGRDGRAPRVGAVLALDGRVICEAHRGQTGPGDHAEYGLLRALSDQDVTGATLYTTLEPCSSRPSKVPCARHVVQRGITTVWIGIYDTNPKVYRAGWKFMNDAGIVCRDFPSDLRATIANLNASFLAAFTVGEGDTGSAAFDYTLNGSRYEVLTKLCGRFMVTWSPASNQSIYLYNGDASRQVALAWHARTFDQVDDPGAYNFDRYASLTEGDIGIVQNPDGYLLIRVADVQNARYGDQRNEVSIEWEVRSPR